MYERFYGLQERPFSLTPNPRYLYLTPQHQEALHTLYYGVFGHQGVTLVTGDAGTGKTTLLRAAFDSPRGGRDDHLLYLNNPILSRTEFVEFMASGFGLSRRATYSKSRMLLELHKIIADRHARGGVTALVIDEAQSLPDELLEEVRLLANIETTEEKLLPLVLVGQPELADRLNRPSLRQLKQRVAMRCVVEPLDLRQTAAYITMRVWIAGGNRKDLFTREAIEAVYELSRGIPRSVCVICDNALIAGLAADERPVRRSTVVDVCRDLDLRPFQVAVPFRAAPSASAPSVLGWAPPQAMDQPAYAAGEIAAAAK